jgi:hypothetical protein
MAFRPVQQGIPWVGCAAATVAVVGLLLFGLRGEPVDLGKYLGATPLPALATQDAPADRPVTVSEGSGRMAPDASTGAAPEHPTPRADIAPERIAAAPAQIEPAKAEPVEAEPASTESASTESANTGLTSTEPASAAPAATPDDTGAMALLSPEPPRAITPTPKARPRARSQRRPASLSAVARRARTPVRRNRGRAMQTITIFHGAYVEVVRVPR